MGIAKSPQRIILEVLNIIGYENDKNKFTNDLIQLCEKQAFINLIKIMPNDKQESLNKDLSTGENTKDILAKYFSEEQKNDAIKSATSQIIEDYIKTIMPTLNKDQLIKLEEHFKNMRPISN